MLSDATRDEIERRAVLIQAEIEAKTGPYFAEIVPDCHPQWHLVRTAPADEAKAMRYLTERGFGVYLPMFRSFAIRRGRKAKHSTCMFPGYVFLFVWDVKRHWRRIRSCPGVVTVACIDEVPVLVPDEIVNRLQLMEFHEDETWEGWRSEPKRKRRKKNRGAQHDDDWLGTVTISTRSFWNDIMDVDSERRLNALNQALGLAS